jgi:hypothetical protein
MRTNVVIPGLFGIWTKLQAWFKSLDTSKTKSGCSCGCGGKRDYRPGPR